jgi:hypothetical protein
MKRVYISTPLKPEKFRLDQIQREILYSEVFAFIPTTAEVKGDPTTAALINKQMIEFCDELWAFGPIGRDCAWELGFASALNKPIKFFATEENEHMIPTDWMLFNTGGVEVVKV